MIRLKRYAKCLCQRCRDMGQLTQSFIAHITGPNRHPFYALANVADDVHRAHRTAGADDIDAIIVSDFTRRRNGLIPLLRITSRGSRDAHAAVMDASDRRHHRTGKLFLMLDDVDQSVFRYFRE